jgi:hypothetical protein
LFGAFLTLDKYHVLFEGLGESVGGQSVVGFPAALYQFLVLVDEQRLVFQLGVSDLHHHLRHFVDFLSLLSCQFACLFLCCLK